MSLFRFPVIFSAAALAVGTLLFSCGGKQKTETVAEDVQITPVMTASADSLYNFVEDQVNFGPRTPGSEGHAACVDYIVRSVRMFGADTVMIHEAPVTTYRGDTFTARNIFAQFNPGARRRVLLLAHYDTRPWATEDSDKEARMRPIDGANDGGSGVSVLLEVARNLGLHPLDSVGVDLLFTDVEDSGQSETWGAQEETWCLGTQEWVKDMPYDDTNRPEFGILLDMVGGKDAKFHREYFSQQHAKNMSTRYGLLPMLRASANGSSTTPAPPVSMTMYTSTVPESPASTSSRTPIPPLIPSTPPGTPSATISAP